MQALVITIYCTDRYLINIHVKLCIVDNIFNQSVSQHITTQFSIHFDYNVVKQVLNNWKD